jgi:cell division protein FtsL
MTRINALLLIAVLFSAFYLVRTQYDSRRLYTEYDRARSESRRLDLERERLEVERRSQGTSLRVEKVAKEQLHMRNVSPAITQYVLDPTQVLANGDKPDERPPTAPRSTPSRLPQTPTGMKTQVAGSLELKNESSTRIEMP